MGRRAVLFLYSTAPFSVPPRCKDGRGTIRKMRLCFHIRKLVCLFCALAVLKETALFLLVTAMLGLGSGGFSLHTVWKIHLNVFLCRVSPVPGDPTGPVLHLLGPPEAHRLPRRGQREAAPGAGGRGGGPVPAPLPPSAPTSRAAAVPGALYGRRRALYGAGGRAVSAARRKEAERGRRRGALGRGAGGPWASPSSTAGCRSGTRASARC